MEPTIQLVLIGILIMVGSESIARGSTQTPLITSFACREDVLKKYPAVDTKIHVQGTGERDQVIFDADIKGVHKGNNAAKKDCYINSGSWKITDANLENTGKSASGLDIYKNSQNDFRFRLEGQTPGQDVAYQVTLWGKKDEKVSKEVTPYATCCDV